MEGEPEAYVGSFVKITNREIYDALQRIDRTTDRMDGRLNNVLADNHTLGKRVRALEIKVYGLLAGFAGAVVMLFRFNGLFTGGHA